MKLITIVCLMAISLFVFQLPLTSQERCVPVPEEFLATTPTSSNPLSFQKATAGWAIGTKLPIAKKYHTIASFNGEVYVFAGVTLDWQFNNTCYKYTVATDKWTKLADFPVSAFIHGQAQVINGKIYIFGGLSNQYSSYKTVPNVWEYNPATNKFTEKAPLPIQQGWGTSGQIDGKIYFIAGSGAAYNTFVKTVQVFDPVANSWTTATNFPRDVCWIGAASVNNKIVAAGGYNLNYTPSRYIADTYVGEISAGNLIWTKMKDYPIGPIIFVGGVGLGDNGYFAGGRPATDNNKPSTQRSFRYSLSLNTWETLQLKPTGVQGLNQLGTDGNRIVCPGGEDSSSTGKTLDINEIFDPVAQASPLFVLNTTSVNVVMKRGAPIKQQLTFKNIGGVPLTWSIALNPASNWLSVSKISGTINSMGSEIIDLTFTADGINSGGFTTNLIVTTNDPGHTTTTIPVTFYLQDQDIDTEMNVLVEEGTGTWCGFCPYGADTVKAMEQRFPGRVHGISYHGGSTTEPMLTPFTDPWTKQVGLTGWPGASANRVAWDGETGYMLGAREKWSPRVEQLLTTRRSPVTLRVVEGGCNPLTKLGRMKVEIFFHQPVAKNLRLSIAQVESGLNWTQTFYPPSGGSTKIYPYFHENVVRQLIPNAFGEVISSGNAIASQSTVTKEIWFSSKDSVRAESRFVIFLHECDGVKYGEVLQSIEHSLAQLTDVTVSNPPQTLTLSQNYPNPVSIGSHTTIRYSLPVKANVLLQVYDAFGREVQTIEQDAKEAGIHYASFHANVLSAGIYFYRLSANGASLMQSMIVMK